MHESASAATELHLNQRPEGVTHCVAQVTHHSRELGVAIAQTSCDTATSHQRSARKGLQTTLDREGVMIQADALPSCVGSGTSQSKAAKTRQATAARHDGIAGPAGSLNW